MRFVVKPNTKYTFGLQAIRTTKEGIIATNIIQNTVITTPDKSNFKGVVQVTDDANYLYQKTTLRLGQNANIACMSTIPSVFNFAKSILVLSLLNANINAHELALIGISGAKVHSYL